MKEKKKDSDITARKRAEEALLQARDEWENTFDSLTDMVTIHDNNFNIVRANSSARRMLRLPLSDNLTNAKCFTYYHGAQKPPEGCPSYSCLETGQSCSSEVFEPDLNRHLEILAIPRFDTHRRRIGLVHIVRDITERKRAEDKLQKSEAILKEAQALGRIGSWEFDLDSRTVQWSDQVYRLYERDPAMGPPKEEEEAAYYSPEQAGMLREYAQIAGEQGQAFEYDLEAQLPSGRIACFAATMHPVRDRSGRIVKLFGTVQDITERKRLEEALRESEKKYRLLIDTANESIVVAQDGLLKFVNPATLGLLEGYSEQELMDRPFPEFIHPDDRSMVVENYRRRIANEAVQPRYAFRVVARDGIVKWVEINAALIEWQGKPATLNFLTDITERKGAEAMLRESEEKYKVLFEGSSLGILATDMEAKRFVFANPSMCRMLGYSAAELLQLGVSDIHSKDALAQIKSGMEIQVREGTSLIREISCLRKDGTEFFADIGGASTFVNGRRLVVGFFTDVSERKRAEDEIRQKSKELQEKNDELTRFIYAVSHDLRSPLVTIQTFQGQLEQDLRSRDAALVAKDLGYIRGAADKMGRLLDEIRRLSRVGRFVNPSEEAPLQEIVKEALDLVAGRITARGVRVDLTQEPVVLYGDRTRLVEIFQNLVDNAAKFMGDQPSPRVEIGVEQAGEELVLHVRDNGIGIDPELQPLVFGLFHKLDPGSEGEGIGLALVRRIVELHGGRIWVESKGPGKGTTFRFTLAKMRRGVGRIS